MRSLLVAIYGLEPVTVASHSLPPDATRLAPKQGAFTGSFCPGAIRRPSRAACGPLREK